MRKKLLAEAFGTYWLVFAGCGSAVLAAGVPEVGIGWLGVSLAFGLSVVTMAYAVGNISGGHFNPAVSFGLMLAGRFEKALVLPYWAAQVVGATLAAATLYIIASGQPEFAGTGGFASNGYGDASPGGYSMLASLTVEIVLTAFFLIIILGVTAPAAPVGFAPLAIGLALTLIHLLSIPVDNTSVNPARSTGVAFFAEGAALSQLWLFWVAPLLGGALGALCWSLLSSDERVVSTDGQAAN